LVNTFNKTVLDQIKAQICVKHRVLDFALLV